MKIKVKDKEYSFDGYVLPLNSVQRVAELCYEQGRADAIEDSFNSLLLMVKNGYDYPNAEFEKTFIALVEDAIDSVKDKLKEQKE